MHSTHAHHERVLNQPPVWPICQRSGGQVDPSVALPYLQQSVTTNAPTMLAECDNECANNAACKNIGASNTLPVQRDVRQGDPAFESQRYIIK
jgi:hypothetical protein